MSLAQIERFAVRQKVTLMVNRYAIHALGPNDELGPLLAVAQQKRMAFKEQVTFYSDDSRSVPVFSFKARQAIDLGATYDVHDASGQPIGLFKKDFKASLLRSTWFLEAAGIGARGQERSQVIAIFRRFINLPFTFHFDFHDPAGAPTLFVERKFSLRDHYTVTVPGGRLDGRVAAAMAVALDALQGR